MTGLTVSNLFIHPPTPNRKQLFWNDLLKRIFDVTASFIGLLLLFPVFVVIAIAIKRDSPGPIFYRGWRLGKDDKRFLMLKFRTMREEAASYSGPRLTAQDDKRVTAFGRWLRDSKLNELPQLWNVLKGEMSLVGPRPEDPELATSWPLDVRAQILSVRPGITSPASVLYRDEEEMLLTKTLMKTYLRDILPSKLRLDQLYIHRRSFLLDLDVLFWTFLVLLPGLKRRKPPEESLFVGVLSRLGKRYLNWFVIDTLTTLAAFILVGLFWRVFSPLNIGFPQALLYVAVYSLIFSLAGALYGVQRIVWRDAIFKDMFRLVPSTLLALFATLAINYLRSAPLPFGMMLWASSLAFTGYVLTRYRQRILTGLVASWLHLRNAKDSLRERVLVIGSGETARFVAWSLMNEKNSRAFQVVGFVDDDIFKNETQLHDINVLGKKDEIPSLVQHYDVGVIVYAVDHPQNAESQEVLEICKCTGARVIVWPNSLAFRSQTTTPDDPQQSQAPWKNDQTYQQFYSWLDRHESSNSQYG